jgi:hypothetical protein
LEFTWIEDLDLAWSGVIDCRDQLSKELSQARRQVTLRNSHWGDFAVIFPGFLGEQQQQALVKR